MNARTRIGVILIITGLLFFALFINNTVVYRGTLESRILYIREQAQKYGFETETIQLLEASYLIYSPSDWISNLILSAPTESDLLSKAILFDSLLKMEKTLAEVLAGQQHKLAELEQRVAICEQNILAIWDHIKNIYNNMETIMQSLVTISQRVAQLEQRIGNLEQRIGNLAQRIATVEQNIQNTLRLPSGVARTVNNVINTVSSAVGSVINTVKNSIASAWGLLTRNPFWWLRF